MACWKQQEASAVAFTRVQNPKLRFHKVMRKGGILSLITKLFDSSESMRVIPKMSQNVCLFLKWNLCNQIESRIPMLRAKMLRKENVIHRFAVLRLQKRTNQLRTWYCALMEPPSIVIAVDWACQESRTHRDVFRVHLRYLLVDNLFFCLSCFSFSSDNCIIISRSYTHTNGYY